MPNDADGNLAKEVIFTIAQSLTRGDYDTFPGMDAHRIEIFHVTDGDTVIVGVTHDLVFDFLPAFEELLNKNLSPMGKDFVGSMSYFISIHTLPGTNPPDRFR